jgi:hypothetical protein
MISFNFNVRNPRSNTFKNLWSRSYCTPFKNKFVELEIYRTSNLISVMFNWTICQDHAGVDIEFDLFGHCVHFQFYDNRHWNFETKNYEL